MVDSGWRTFSRFTAALTSIVVLTGTTHAAQAAHAAPATRTVGTYAAPAALTAQDRAVANTAAATQAVLTFAAAMPVHVTTQTTSDARSVLAVQEPAGTSRVEIRNKRCGPCVLIAVPVVAGGVAEILAGATALAVVAGVTIYVTETVKVNGFTIPAPKKSRKKEKTRNHAVYAIRYRKSRKDTHRYIWKYGITGQKDVNARPKSQLAACKKKSKSPFNCTYEFRAKKATWFSARSLEQNLIYVYTKKYGKCPPGHLNAKKVCL